MSGGSGEDAYDWQASLYAATQYLNWTREEYWAATPALLDGQLRQRLRAQKRAGKKGRGGSGKPLKVSGPDKLPGGFW